MTKNKFSTRLERKESKVIVSIFEKRCRKRKLSLILPVLDSIEQHYSEYEWTLEKLTAYRAAERAEIEDNEQKIADAIKKSILLEFRSGPDKEE